MSEKKQVTTQPAPAMFSRENYMWMIAGIVIIALGMLLMSGGKSDNPNEFNQKEVYSTTRITIAPLLIVIGLGIQIVGLLKNPKQQQS
ncbi:MAG: DUF3098 domain-containing protein [Bacteroidetes bacterium]|nr:DUF3098 domain-containing protein [Bacteroidota bacterium]